MKRFLIFILFIVSFQTLNAQTPSNVIVNIAAMPPYSPYLTDYLIYQNQTVMTVTAIGTPGDTYQIYFKGSIIGDNGVSIKTRDDHYPTTPFIIQANTPIQLRGNELESMFDWGNVDINGVSIRNVIRTNGVPEGNYTICLQAYDYITKAMIGVENCSSPINIQHVNPPMLTGPICENQVKPLTPQTLLFSWTYNPGVTPSVRYLIKIVELLDNQNPNDAINSQTSPAFFEKTVSSINYLYSSIDPVLKPGKKYAWRVKAYDLNGKVKFKNNGESEVCVFDYSDPNSNIDQADITTSTNSHISGKAQYYFVEKNSVVPKNGSGIGNLIYRPLKNTQVELIEVYSLTELIKVKKVIGKEANGTPKYGWVDSLATFQNYDFLLGSTKPNPTYPKTANCGRIVSHTTTDEMGNYSFDIPATFKSEIIDTFSISAAESTDGKFHRVAYATGLWLKFRSNYYYGGGQVFYIQKQIHKDGVVSTQQAKNYSLKVNLKNYNQSKNYYSNQIIPTEGHVSEDVTVYVLRRKKSINTPFDECNANGQPISKTISGKQYWVYAQKTAKQNESVVFNDLIQNIYDGDGVSFGDPYYIYAEPKDAKNVKYAPVKFNWAGCSGSSCNETVQFDMYMSQYVEKEVEIAPYHVSLTVSGKVKGVFSYSNGTPNYNTAKPLANTPIKLVGQWVIKNEADQKIYPINGNSNDFASGTTNADGEFTLNTGNTSFLQLGANGLNQYMNSSGDYYQKDGTSKTVTGKEYYVLRIIVQSPYYYSPDNDLLIEPGYNYELGDLFAQVREANLTLDGIKATNLDLPFSVPGGLTNPIKKSGERVYLCLKPKAQPENFPLNQNKIQSTSRKEIISKGITYQVIDETISKANGICEFTQVVLNDPNNVNDRYYYYTESPDQSFDNYNSEQVNSLKAFFDPTIEQKTFYNSNKYLKQYNMQKDLHAVSLNQNLFTFAQTPTIIGAVYPESNYSTNPLHGVKVEVFDIPEDAISKIGFGQNGFSGAFFCAKLKVDYGITPEATMITGMNGKFQFDVDTKSTGKSGRKLVYFSKNGFTPYGYFVNAGAKIQKGQKAALGKIFMELPATVLGKVVDAETGEYIHAKVVVGEDFSWSETNESFSMIKQGNIFVPGPVNGQTLTMEAPYAKGVAFHVYPADNDTYEPLHENHDINLFGSQANFTFKVKRRQHHIVIRAHSPGSDYIKNTIPIKAYIMNTTPDIVSTQTTVYEKDNNNVNTKVYQANLDFPSSAKTFLVKIESLTQGDCYESKIVSIEDDGKYLHTFNFELKPCKKIICHAKTDKGLPAANVKIYVEDLPYTVPAVYTDVNGNAELMGVPTDGQHVIVAIPPTEMTNYIGSRKTVNIASYNGAKINMTVRYFDAMDITSLLGFPMEVKNITMGLGANLGKFYISGSLKANTGNSTFIIPAVSTGVGSMNSNKNFDFENIEIIASKQKGTTGLPLAVPKTDFWSTTTIKSIRVFSQYDAYAFSAFGIFVKKDSETSGKLQAPVSLEPAMFKKGFSIPDIGNTMYISNPNYSGKIQNIDIAEYLDLFLSSGDEPTSLGKTFKVSTWNYKNAWFKLHNRYFAEAKINGSTFDKDGLHLNTILHTNIAQLSTPDINLNIGNVDVRTNEVGNLASTTPIEIPMDKWKFAINNWTLNETGLIVSGKILAGALAVPAKKVLIENDRFNYGEYEVDGIKLGGNLSLNLDKNKTMVSFGYDAGFGSYGSWSLSMLPLNGDILTGIKNLPGLNSSDVINLKNISLYSKGTDDENSISISESTPMVTVHGITKFRPSMAFATTGTINFRGKLDLQIAQLSELADAFTLRYEAKNGGLTLLPPDQAFSNLTLNTKGVKVIFNTASQEFTSNKLVLHGKIKDQNPAVAYAFDITMTKTNIGTQVKVDGNTQKFVYSGGGSGLEKIIGEMTMKSNKTEWNNFAFEGDYYGLPGISEAQKHVKFVVEGDLVANNQNVGVNNLAIDGLGTGSLTYDFNQKAIVGHLHIDRDLSNCHLAGDVDLKFGGGDWYIFGSTIATDIKNSPVNSGKCGFFVGKGSISGNIQTILSQYFYQQLLPDPFPKGNYMGALFCTEAAIPVPIIPQIDINMDPIVHCTLEHAIHMNCYSGLSLDFPKVSYDLGGQIYAYIHAGAGASIGIACVGADFKASAGAGMYGHIDLNIPGLNLNPVQMMSNIKDAILNANITMQGEVFLDLQGTAYVGGGLCDSDCDGWFCETTSWSKGMDIILTATYKKGDGIRVEGKKWNFH